MKTLGNWFRRKLGLMSYCPTHRTHWNYSIFTRCPACSQDMELTLTFTTVRKRSHLFEAVVCFIFLLIVIWFMPGPW